MTSLLSAEEFLAANEISVTHSTWANVCSDGPDPDSDAETVADIALNNWTFDGEISCDRAELVAALTEIRNRGW